MAGSTPQGFALLLSTLLLTQFVCVMRAELAVVEALQPELELDDESPLARDRREISNTTKKLAIGAGLGALAGIAAAGVVYGVQKYKQSHNNATTTESPDASTGKSTTKGHGHSSNDDEDVKPWGGRHSIPSHRAGVHRRTDED